jgi:hypothetical protein
MTTLKETTIARRDRKLISTVDTGPGLTEQSHKDQCDINLILADYTKTGFIAHAKQNQGTYDDVSAVDFQTAMVTVANVKSLFEGLPSQVRKEFQHDPTYFLKYVQDPANAKMLEQRGILIGNDGININGVQVATPKPKAGETASTGTVDSASQQTSDSASE